LAPVRLPVSIFVYDQAITATYDIAKTMTAVALYKNKRSCYSKKPAEANTVQQCH